EFAYFTKNGNMPSALYAKACRPVVSAQKDIRMSNSNQLIRWTVAGRWIATVGIGIVVALGYALFRPAHAQDRGPQSSDKAAIGKPAAGAEKTSAAPPSKADGGSRLTAAEILNK